MKSAEQTLKKLHAALEERKEKLAEITVEVRANRKRVAEAEADKAAGEVDYKKAETEKAELVRLRDECYETLKAGGCESRSDEKKAQAGVQKLLGFLELQESLKHSLPGVLEKAPADRGTFDVIVLDQFEGDLKRRLSELEETLKNGAPAAVEREKVVAGAMATLQESKDRQRTA